MDKSGADGLKDEEMNKLKARACAAALPAPDRLPRVTYALRPPAAPWPMQPGPGALSQGTSLAYAARAWCTLERVPGRAGDPAQARLEP